MAAMHRTLAKASHDSGVLIAGAGVIGLSTAKAIAFSRPDLRVVVSAPELGVTSGVAGGKFEANASASHRRHVPCHVTLTAPGTMHTHSAYST